MLIFLRVLRRISHVRSLSRPVPACSFPALSSPLERMTNLAIIAGNSEDVHTLVNLIRHKLPVRVEKFPPFRSVCLRCRLEVVWPWKMELHRKESRQAGRRDVEVDVRYPVRNFFHHPVINFIDVLFIVKLLNRHNLPGNYSHVCLQPNNIYR